MTKREFERMSRLNQEIQKYSDLIGRIRLGISVKKQKDKKSEKENDKWTLLRFFRLMFKGEKVIVMPHYEFAQGIEMDADAELIGVIIDYLEKKKKECEAEFEWIGKEEE